MKSFTMKHKWIVIIFILFITLAIPFIINELYKMGKGYITIWGAADVLSFYGSYISFLGTIVLGTVSVWQSGKAYKINEQLQKLQQAEFISIVYARKVVYEKRSSSDTNFTNRRNMDISATFDLKSDKCKSEECYYIDIELKNDSKYPIVEMNVHSGDWLKASESIYGMKTEVNKAINIEAGKSACFRYIIPCKYLDMCNITQMKLCIECINIFDYITPAALYIKDLNDKSEDQKYIYRLSKFIDIKTDN